jgi:hypothetical protein
LNGIAAAVKVRVVRYHLLRASGSIRKIGVCLGLLAFSYLMAALANAAPVTQPALVSPFERGRVIVLTPTQPQDPATIPVDPPVARPEPAPVPTSAVQTI